MKRTILTLITVLVMLASLASCKPDEPKENNSYINGVKLAEYSIVYSDEDHYAHRAATYIRDEIYARTGVKLEVVEDSKESSAAYEIVVGETEREISARLDADTEGVEFAILAEDTQIALEGDYFVIAAAAYYFVDTYVPENDYSAEVPKEVSVHEPITREAKNFILLIGDGMGVNQTHLFEAFDERAEYSDGEDAFYGYMLPYLGYARTSSLSGVTDSAAAGTALSCGIKTKNGYVGQNEHHEDVQSITELSAILGKATAVMSTETSTGATPAAFSSHVEDRSYDTDIIKDQNMLKDTYGTLISCYFNHYTETKVEGIESRISTILDTLDNDTDGFFLMYEEAHIDKHSHSNDMENAYLAVQRFNQAIAEFMQYAFYHPETVIIITADHETGGLTVTDNGDFAYTTTDHTNSDVPVFAYGKGVEYFDGTTVENTDIPKRIAALMGVDDFGR
jgi:alkaline phosphatase